MQTTAGAPFELVCRRRLHALQLRCLEVRALDNRVAPADTVQAPLRLSARFGRALEQTNEQQDGKQHTGDHGNPVSHSNLFHVFVAG